MDYKLLLCESCENLISMKDNDKPLFTCPVCGCLNDRIRKTIYEGHLCITGPTVECEIDNDRDEGSPFVITDLDPEVSDALHILMDAGWSIKFKGSRLD
jgi:predicted RNA-binding Zn-ribbon protein involved in translation (DUF1610 family)